MIQFAISLNQLAYVVIQIYPIIALPSALLFLVILQIPKPGGVKRGWMKTFAVVCDFKIIFYEVTGSSQVSNTMLQVIDMR